MTIAPYKTAIELTDDHARLVLAPEHGAAVLRYDWIGHGTITPIFRPAPNVCRTTSDFAMIVLVPWVNRIAGGGFGVNGVFHPLEPNVAGEPFPIHGNGFQSPWAIVRQTATSVDLTLTSHGPGPYRYRADYTFTLTAGALSVTLSVTNLADIALPFGLGFHPWIVRHPDTRLMARADRVWGEDTRHLPTDALLVASVPHVDFRASRELPPDWINASFDGWDGFARIASTANGFDLTIEAAATLGLYHLYSPNADADFLCFEPVSHIPDGFNRTDPPVGDHLLPGAERRVACRFSPWHRRQRATLSAV